ncbi:S41 family peptidase [Croceivirga sp. JEA036]|uniref:S41 family peptidase n=1 Tax=Croceivirga sp. JEA036 TaxID=2721162 RepID=UPI00143BA9A5|nr:S41 family peptidase [Croceivirga sp. JEA036]NJB37923.1 carboxyl-terminal protease [Croceivirga sp. JEA036]
MKKLKILSLLLLGLSILACNNDDDVTVKNNVVTQNFMWRAMNLWYFWQQDVNDLADDRFSSEEEYQDYLAQTSDPELFYKNLQVEEDRFSFSNPNYKTLVNNLSGISKSNGLEFGLVRYPEGSNIFGYVRYIVPNSDASNKDIVRGDIFNRVDGQQLTDANYTELLFGSNDTYTLGLATFNEGEITELEEEVSLTKFEGLAENPVLIAKTLDVQGTKIAYLMYNGFTNEYDKELNNAFAEFKANGATELVLDFRYNPGGSVNSSRLLASMVYGTNTSDLYIKQRWNDKIQAQFDPADVEDYFAADVDGTALNTLNLSKAYVITSARTASASELLINGLNPYIEMIKVGDTTRGKNEFSITMVDDPDNSYIYRSSREGNINPDNSWAIQPLVGRNENADGFSDYTAGIAPDFYQREDYGNLGVLGEETEPLLARCLQEITGATAKGFTPVVYNRKELTGSEMFTAVKNNMWLDNPPRLK